MTEAIISIRPHLVQQIIDGEKTMECRRRLPALKPGDRVAMYATTPVRQVAGTFQVAELVRLPVGEFIDRYAEDACVSRDGLFGYFAGHEFAGGIVMRDIRVLEPPLRLRFHPPQSWMRLDADRPGHKELLAGLNGA